MDMRLTAAMSRVESTEKRASSLRGLSRVNDFHSALLPDLARANLDGDGDGDGDG